MGLFNLANQNVKTHAWLLIFINGALALGGFLAFGFVASSLWLAIGWLLSAILLILSLFTGIRRMWRLSPYTQEGEDIVAPIQGFKDMLNDIGHFDRSQVGDLIDQPEVHNYEIPPYDAVTSQVLLSRDDPTDKAFSAWLMELAAAGEITIEQTDGQPQTYRLTETAKLTPAHHTNDMLRFIFDRSGTAIAGIVHQGRKAAQTLIKKRM